MQRRLSVLAALLLSITIASGCAYFLSPHQRGNRGGPIDAPALVGDLLWFIPGIIPGVVALTVDFTSGAIHKSSYRVRVGPAAAERKSEPGNRRVSARPPVSPGGYSKTPAAVSAPD